MGSRGGGRGRGRFGGGDFRYAKQEPFVLFPEIELPDRKNVTEVKNLVGWRFKFEDHFRDSPYFLEETLGDEDNTVDIERYSDKGKKRGRSGGSSLLDSGFIKLEPGYFPLELVRGTKRRTGRKVQWNPQRDLKRLDMLEDLEKNLKDDDPKTKKDNEDEEEEEDMEAELESEDDESDDYYQGADVDDDDDDYNQVSDGDGEDIL